MPVKKQNESKRKFSFNNTLGLKLPKSGQKFLSGGLTFGKKRISVKPMGKTATRLTRKRVYEHDPETYTNDPYPSVYSKIIDVGGEIIELDGRSEEEARGFDDSKIHSLYDEYSNYVKEPRKFGRDTHSVKKSGYDSEESYYQTIHAKDPELNKMYGMASISTTTRNEFCKKNYIRAKKHNSDLRNKIKNGIDVGGAKEMICEHCYAKSLEDTRKNVRDCYIVQGERITSRVLQRDEIPKLNPGEVIRLNAFGDLDDGKKGVTLFINYLNLAMYNPQAYFTLWTKNVNTVNEAYRKIGYKKPDNLTIIWSNPFIDKLRLTPPPTAPWADGVFNVVRRETFDGIEEGYDSEHGVNVYKCSRQCLKCRVCYSGYEKFAIVELIKSESRSGNGHYRRVALRRNDSPTFAPTAMRMRMRMRRR